MYIQTKCTYKPNVYTKMYIQMRINVMTKDKVYTMRTDMVFRKNLAWLSRELGLPKSQCIELVINLYPELVKMYAKHQQLLDDLKDKLK